MDTEKKKENNNEEEMELEEEEEDGDVEEIHMNEIKKEGEDEENVEWVYNEPTDDYMEEEEGEEGDDVEEGELDEGEIVDDSIVTVSSANEPIYAVGFNPVDHKMFATGGGDDMVRLWKLESSSSIALDVNTETSAKEIFSLKGHEDSIVSIKFSGDGKYLASAGYDGCVKIWNAGNGDLIQTLSGPADSIDWISWHKKGNVILAGAADATAWMWLASTGACMQVFAGHEDAVSCGDFSGDGKKVLTGSVDGSAKIWNPKTGECQHTFKAGSHGWHSEGVVSMASHDTKPLMLTGGLDGTARLAQIQLNKVLATFSHESSEHGGELYGVETVGFCKTNDWAASGAMDGSCKIWDLNGLRCRQTLKHPGGIIKLHWHKTSPFVITACADAVIRMWDSRSGVLAKEYFGHRDVLLDMDTVFEGDGSGLILTGSDDKFSKIFAFTLPHV